MHGVITGCSLLVNAEVDSMGGVIGMEDGIGTKTSPRQATIEKAQTVLRLEFDVREERRRELEFLEKGGNPLDFRFGVAASLSVQSTSLTDQLHDQFVTSEAKGSFAVANSPKGDSVDSSGRLGAPLACEPNSADNFDGENVLVGNEERATYPGRSKITPSEHSSRLDGSLRARESEGSLIFQPNKAYKRRNRSKANRDSARFSSTDISSHRCLSSSLPSRPRIVSKDVTHETAIANADTTGPSSGCFSEGKLDVSAYRDSHHGMQNQDINDVEVPAATTSGQPVLCNKGEETIAVVGESPPCLGFAKVEDVAVPEQLRELNQLQGDGKGLQSGDVLKNEAAISKGLDSELSCTQTSLSVEVNRNVDSGLCTRLKNVDSNGDGNEQNVPTKRTENIKAERALEERKESYITDNNASSHDIHFPQSIQDTSVPEKNKEETNSIRSSAQAEANSHQKAMEMQPIPDEKQGLPDALVPELGLCSQEKTLGPQEPSVNELNIPGSGLSLEQKPPAENEKELIDKENEDMILEEALIIEVKQTRRKELSIGSLPKENRRKSHWDFVLEEMAWMANDFAQERLWKRTSAAQLCQRAVFASKIKLEEHNKQRKDKIVAQTLASAVLNFWQSAGLHVPQTGIVSDFEARGHGIVVSENKHHERNANHVNECLDEELCKEDIKLAVQRYMVRFMKHNSSAVKHVNTEAFETPERESPFDIPEMTLLNQRTDENLFYVVPPGAMEAYRKSIQIYTMQCEKAGKHMQEYIDTAMNDALTEFGSQENEFEYEEDEGESVYHFSGTFGSHKQPKFILKKEKNSKAFNHMSYGADSNFPYDNCMENRIGTLQSAVVRKRPSSGLNVGSIPTKRVRTASRQRILGPTMGAAGFIPVPHRTDASSEDTNSLQDDQSSLHGGSLIPRGLEVESRMDFDKQSTFDSAETTVKPKKKKKTKYQGEAYGHKWQGDGNMQGEQKDHFKRRMDCHSFELNGSSGMFAQHAKKPKILKQSLNNSFENTTLMSGSVPSPVGTQMSTMSNQNKLIKLISGRDRGRKAKALKMPSGQTGSGMPWSLFEDQALVVLIHDMGPNWELVSDAINSTLYFKCIFRNPKECKERHKILLEKRVGDGADSAEDSGSSQSYPSTLPGIPKGGARQLFQQLRGPIEEDTIKSHFEKIILLGQQIHGWKKQDPKQLVPVHGSHAAAILQVIPDNVNGGVLTPLDLCDMAAASPDVFSLNYQSPRSSGLPLPNQATGQSILSSTGTNSLLQGSPGMGLGSNLAIPSAQLNSPVSGRYGVPRASLPIDEQHRVQQYNHRLSGRNIHQTNTPVSGAFSGNDRGGVGGRMLPGGNGMIMPGMSRNMSVPRPGPQGMSSSPLLNSANTVPPNTVPASSSMNMHPGASPGQGKSVIQNHDAVHMLRNTEHTRQIMPSEMQLKATQVNNQGVSSIGGSSSTFVNQSTSPSSYPVHHLQGPAHPASAEQQAFAMRLARERQLQQRISQRQQHQQFPASGASVSPVSHHSLPNGMQNSSQMQSHSSQSVSMPSHGQSSPMTPASSQMQQKHNVQHHELGQAAQNGVGGMTNQAGKQRHRQAQPLQRQFHQSARHHPPQHQPSQPQKQTKPSKGIGKGNMLMHQNPPVDSSHTNGSPTNPGCQSENGEQAVHLMQGQSNVTQSSASSVPPSVGQPCPQEKLQIDATPTSSKLGQQMPIAISVPTSHLSMMPSEVPSRDHQQFKAHSSPPIKLVNHSQPTALKVVSQNHISDSDSLTKPQYDQSQADQPLANTTVNKASKIQPDCIEMKNTSTCASSASPTHWKTSDQMTRLVFPNGTQRQPHQVQRPPCNPPLLPQKQSKQYQVLENLPQRQPLPNQHHQSKLQVQTADSEKCTTTSNSSLE